VGTSGLRPSDFKTTGTWRR